MSIFRETRTGKIMLSRSTVTNKSVMENRLKKGCRY